MVFRWSDDNVYAKQNGGKYDFIVEPLPPKGDQNPPVGQSGLSIPTSQQLWDDLIANKTEAGVPMVVYEQDWMSVTVRANFRLFGRSELDLCGHT